VLEFRQTTAHLSRRSAASDRGLLAAFRQAPLPLAVLTIDPVSGAVKKVCALPVAAPEPARPGRVRCYRRCQVI
jgi:hypothetical protein